MANRPLGAFGGGAAVGVLGGLIGLGGAEFRLPLLIGPFGFAALDAVILNKTMSLIVVTSSLVFRAPTIPLAAIADHWQAIATLLAGSLVGAWIGASWAIWMRAASLYRVIAILLVLIAAVLLFAHEPSAEGPPILAGIAQIVVGIVAGFAIGVVSALLGVAGGELLIPTLMLLFGADIKLAGSLSLAVSLPTMLVSFARYSRDQSFAVVGRNISFALWMAAGSIAGSLIGGLLVGVVPAAILLPLLAAILLLSAFKVWSHRQM